MSSENSKAVNKASGSGTAIVVAEFDFQGGGPYRSLLRLVNLLLDSGYNVELATCPRRHEDLEILAQENSRLALIPDFPFQRHRGWATRPFSYMKEARKISRFVLKRFREPTSVLIFSLISPGRFLWPHFGNVPAIFLFRSYPLGWKHRLAGPLFRTLIPRKSKIVGVSEFTAKTLAAKWGLNPSDERLDFLRNSTGTGAAEARTVKKGKKTILMVGRVHRDKNPFGWLEVAEKVIHRAPDLVDFVWIGDGVLLEPVVAKLASMGISNHVRFPGFVQNPGDYYESCDLYLHLATVEPMSNAIIDALRHGLPTIASNAGGNPEIVIDGENGFLVDPEDTDYAAQRVLEILRDDELWQRLSNGGRQLFDERFSESALQKNLIRLINESSWS